MEKKQSPLVSASTYVAGIITTLVLTDINGWFSSGKFPIVLVLAGFRFSIGLSLFLTILFLVLMGVAFYAGNIYALLSYLRVLVPDMKMPLLFRIVTVISFPVFKLFSGMLLKWQREERRKFGLSIAEMKKELEKEE